MLHINVHYFSDEEGEDDADLQDAELLQELQEFEEDDAPDPPQTQLMQPIKEGRMDYSNQGEGGNLLAVIDSRIQMYGQAVEVAKKSGDDSRARRFNRGLGTLKKQRVHLLKGIAICDDDIPPAISQSALQPPKPPNEDNLPPSPNPVATPVPAATLEAHKTQVDPMAPLGETVIAPAENVEKSKKLNELKERRKKVAVLALEAKKEGNMTSAVEYLNATKECDMYLKKLEADEISPLQVNIPFPRPPQITERQFSRDEPTSRK